MIYGMILPVYIYMYTCILCFTAGCCWRWSRVCGASIWEWTLCCWLREQEDISKGIGACWGICCNPLPNAIYMYSRKSLIWTIWDQAVFIDGSAVRTDVYKIFYAILLYSVLNRSSGRIIQNVSIIRRPLSAVFIHVHSNEPIFYPYAIFAGEVDFFLLLAC